MWRASVAWARPRARSTSALALLVSPLARLRAHALLRSRPPLPSLAAALHLCEQTSFHTNTSELKKIFTQFGKIDKISFLKDRHCAFIDFGRLEDSLMAFRAMQGVRVGDQGEFSCMYRYILRDSCSQFDSLPLTSLTILHQLADQVVELGFGQRDNAGSGSSGGSGGTVQQSLASAAAFSLQLKLTPQQKRQQLQPQRRQRGAAARAAALKGSAVDTDEDGFVVVNRSKKKGRAAHPVGLVPVDGEGGGGGGGADAPVRYVVDESALVDFLHETLEDARVQFLPLHDVMALHAAGPDGRFASQLKQEGGAEKFVAMHSPPLGLVRDSAGVAQLTLLDESTKDAVLLHSVLDLLKASGGGSTRISRLCTHLRTMESCAVMLGGGRSAQRNRGGDDGGAMKSALTVYLEQRPDLFAVRGVKVSLRG
jgi:hypothetical protein